MLALLSQKDPLITVIEFLDHDTTYHLHCKAGKDSFYISFSSTAL